MGGRIGHIFIMLCSLLRTIKVFFVGNALFSSQAVVHLDSNRSMVGITYHLEHAGLHLENTVTLIHDLRYASCFKEKVHTAVSDHYLYLSPEVKRGDPSWPEEASGGTRVSCIYLFAVSCSNR